MSVKLGGAIVLTRFRLASSCSSVSITPCSSLSSCSLRSLSAAAFLRARKARYSRLYCGVKDCGLTGWIGGPENQSSSPVRGSRSKCATTGQSGQHLGVASEDDIVPVSSGNVSMTGSAPSAARPPAATVNDRSDGPFAPPAGRGPGRGTGFSICGVASATAAANPDVGPPPVFATVTLLLFLLPSSSSTSPPGPFPPFKNGLSTFLGITVRSYARIGMKSAFRSSSGIQEFQFLIRTKTRSRSLYRESQTYSGQLGYHMGGLGRPRMCRVMNWQATFSMTSSMAWSAKWPVLKTSCSQKGRCGEWNV